MFNVYILSFKRVLDLKSLYLGDIPRKNVEFSVLGVRFNNKKVPDYNEFKINDYQNF